MSPITGWRGSPDAAWRVLPLPFALARCAAWLGAAITLVTVPIVVYARTGSALGAGGAAALEAAPYLLVGLWAGAAADRRSPARLLRDGAGASAGVLTATAVGVAALPDGAGTALLLVGTATAIGLSAFGDAAGFALLPRLVPRERLARANGHLATLGLAVQLAGPGAAAGLLAVGAGAWALLVHAALLGVVVAVSPLIRPADDDGSRPAATPGATRAPDAAAPSPVGTVADAAAAGPAPPTPSAPSPAVTVRDGVRFIRRHPVVGPLTLAGACNSLTAGGVVGVLAVYGHEVLGWATGSSSTALLYAAISLGGLVASLLAPRLVHRHAPARVGTVGLAVSGVGLALLVLVPGPLLSPLWLVLWELAVAVVVLNGIVVRQLVTPLELQGRVGVTGRMIAWGTQPLGALLAGAVAQVWGAQVAMALVAVGSVAAVGTLATAARRRQDLRRPVPARLPDAAGATA